jgi:hypothetical protein
VFRLFGVVIVTLCLAGSTHPVAASGVFAFGAAATQMVCDIWLTNVTRRWSLADWPAAPEGGGSEAAGAVGEGMPPAAGPVGADIREDARDGVAVVLRGCDDGRGVAVCPAAAGLDDPVAGALAVTGACPLIFTRALPVRVRSCEGRRPAAAADNRFL